MRSFRVQTHAAGQSLPREQHLAWKIAECAAAKAPITPAAAEMVGNRIIDNAAVAAAALPLPSVRAAVQQARQFPRPVGASLLGLPDLSVDSSWAAWANGIAVRELDLHDNFYGHGVAHPADAIPAILAVAQHCACTGENLVRAILVAYQVQTALVASIDLNGPGVDHVAHLGPAVAAGIGALLDLDVPVIFEAVNHAAHTACAPLQARKGAISNWKAAAPAHVGKICVEAIDRAMRGQSNPAPIYEGRSGLLATLFKANPEGVEIFLPSPGEPHDAILETYPKAHAAAYHAQALIDLAFRMRGRVDDIEAIRSVVIHTKGYTHNYLGTGSGDPSKFDPDATRETLDHSVMYIFAVALLDGTWHHRESYSRARSHSPETIRLWQKISTREDRDWSERFTLPAPLDKDHGARVEITFEDGRVITEEIAVPEAHPRGKTPYGRQDYIRKFQALGEGIVRPDAQLPFLDALEELMALECGELVRLNFAAEPSVAAGDHRLPRGIFDWQERGKG